MPTVVESPEAWAVERAKLKQPGEYLMSADGIWKHIEWAGLAGRALAVTLLLMAPEFMRR